jgi:hypothetical protein
MTAAAASPVHLSVVVPVWGAEYIRTFLDYCLAAQLSPRNLPVLGRGKGHRYVVYTTPEGRAACSAHRLWPLLEACVEAELRPIEELATFASNEGKYQTKTECYRAELAAAAEGDGAVVMLNADILLADGFLAGLLDLLAAGKRVIEVTGSRGMKAPIERILDERHRQPDGLIMVPAVALSRIWLDHQHPQLRMHYVEEAVLETFHPSHLYWAVGGQGVIIRGFHLYPIAVRPGPQPASFRSVIDDDLVARMAVERSERHLVQDSRQLFCCELSLPDLDISTNVRRDLPDSVVEFYLGYSRENLDNLADAVCITDRDELGAAWQIRLQESRAYVDGVADAVRAEAARRASPPAEAEPAPVPVAAAPSPAATDAPPLAPAAEPAAVETMFQRLWRRLRGN